MRLFLTILFSILFYISGLQPYTINQRCWDYKGHKIAYECCEVVRSITSSGKEIVKNANEAADPVLILNGFGVGSFHQHRLMPQLLTTETGEIRKVYGVDYLGQGRSWPTDCQDGKSESERGLRYCIDTWADQVITFIDHIILSNDDQSTVTPKVHLVGNSVGGLLSVILALRRPDLVGSICLLNATPVWGLNLPGWSGRLPAPFLPKFIGRVLFDFIRNPQTIEKYLENAYSNREAFDSELIQQIRKCTEDPGGHAAFASIMWSPPTTFDSEKESNFYSSLAKLSCDVLLLFGKDDPWCKPAFAKRMYKCLSQRDSADGNIHRYVELDNVGHCPNHEAPAAVGRVVRRWLDAGKAGRGSTYLVDGNHEQVSELWGNVIIREADADDSELNLVDKIIASLL